MRHLPAILVVATLLGTYSTSLSGEDNLLNAAKKGQADNVRAILDKRRRRECQEQACWTALMY